MEEKYDKFIDNYTDMLMIFWETITDAFSAAWKVLEVFILIPIIMLMIFVSFPVYCVVCLIKRMVK